MSYLESIGLTPEMIQRHCVPAPAQVTHEPIAARSEQLLAYQREYHARIRAALIKQGLTTMGTPRINRTRQATGDRRAYFHTLYVARRRARLAEGLTTKGTIRLKPNCRTTNLMPC